MTVSQKPVILLVHGAWHRPIHFFNLINHFQSQGYDVRAPALATVGWHESVGSKTVADDVVIIRGVLEEYFSVGREVVVVCHSFSGFSGTDSVVGEAVAERQARGLSGGVKAMVYIAAFAPPAPGTSLTGAINYVDESSLPDWWTIKGKLALLTSKGPDMLYSGGVNQELVQVSINATAPQSWLSFQSCCLHAASEIAAPKIFLATAGDLIIPYEGQKGMALAAGAELITLESGHSPFLVPDQTPKVIDAIEKAAQ